jgi:hypothetical protein
MHAVIRYVNISPFNLPNDKFKSRLINHYHVTYLFGLNTSMVPEFWQLYFLVPEF